MVEKKTARRYRIRKRIRRKICGTTMVPRLSVYRSNRGMYVQLIDDIQRSTLLSASTRSLGIAGIDIGKAKKLGMAIAEKALDKKIKKVVFDRSGYLYHGKVKALAEGAREGGLKF